MALKNLTYKMFLVPELSVYWFAIKSVKTFSNVETNTISMYKNDKKNYQMFFENLIILYT